MNVIYCIASVVPVWNWFLLIVVAFTGGLGVLCGGHWTNKEEIHFLEVIWREDGILRKHERAKCMYSFYKSLF